MYDTIRIGEGHHTIYRTVRGDSGDLRDCCVSGNIRGQARKIVYVLSLVETGQVKLFEMHVFTEI